MSKVKNIEVQGALINLYSDNNLNEDFICITDMAKAREGSARAADIIKNWIRTRTTLEFLGTWEQLNNPNFKVVEFDHFKMNAGLPSFVLSVSQWIENTNAIGLYTKSGRYGGTYAHVDIALEFGSAISPVFKLYMIKEYKRLKESETNQYSLEWNVKRMLSKTNYLIQTDAVQKHIIPKKNYGKNKEWLAYAEEGDLLNVIIFGCTAADWREANPEHANKNLNIRDFASINELAVLSNIESMNAVLIQEDIDKESRFLKLQRIANYQLEVLNAKDSVKAIKKLSKNTYLDK